MPQYRHFAAWGLALLLLSGCENPADNVPKAQTAEAAPSETPAANSDTDAESEPAPENATAAGVEVLPINSETTTLGFIGSKVTGSHEGGFKKVSGTFHVVPERLEESRLEAEVDMDSTWSDSERLTGHLKNPDFFDVEQYPTSKFVSTKIEPIESGDGTHSITGNLTLHGVTKSITFPATIKMSNDGVNVDAEFAINRKDFGIVYAGKPDDLIRDEVVIKLSIRAPRIKAAQAR